MSAENTDDEKPGRRRGESAARGGSDDPPRARAAAKPAIRRARPPHGETERPAMAPASIYDGAVSGYAADDSSKRINVLAVAPKSPSPKLRHAKIERVPLHNEIVPVLRQEIISAKWLPGQRLPESLLCERFGVSRTPLRDALKALAAEGLVELTHNSGAVVTHPNADDIEGKLAVIELLECYAAREACTKASDAELRHIHKLHQQMGEAFARRDMSRNYRLNNEVHAAIIEASHNSTLVDLHANLWRHVERLRFLALVHQDVSVDSWAEHEAFVRAIMARNGAAAASTLRAHLRRVARKINKELQTHGALDVGQPR